MGNYFSTTYDQKFDRLEPYLMEIHSKGTINLNILTYIGPSKIPNAGEGLFAGEFIPKDTFFVKISDDTRKMNDPLIDLTDIMKAETAEDFYRSLKESHEKYYDLEKAKEKINVILCEHDGEKYMKTIKDVDKDDELYRGYDFDTWVTYYFKKIAPIQFVYSFQRFVEEYHRYTLGRSNLNDDMLKLIHILDRYRIENNITE